MKKNMGTTDRIVRLIVAAGIAGLYLSGIVEGTLGLILLALALVFTVTSLIGFCPLYLPFNLNTCPGKK
ncbi:YgaP family membrane protein [Robertkochia aurantiaca]|uniref:YgaP family membrane protein n=1 Tax=Robertkochia aurantiaca TaxID=2873700 RepID=UPI001CCE5D9A|nr:DUF2892 domain-containing protein [Robertkochia sp. 3YJGBD-33]